MGAHPSRDEDAFQTAQKKRYNRIVKGFAEGEADIFFLDLYDHPEFLRKDIFIEDGVHFNQDGYDLYAAFYQEALKEECAKY